MNGLKYFLISIGLLSIVLFIVLLIIGIKVISAIVFYTVGIIAAISAVGLIIYYIGKLRERENPSNK